METETRLTGPQIRAARGLLGISQPALAAVAGVARQTVATIEGQGEVPPGSGAAVTAAFRDLGVRFTTSGVELNAAAAVEGAA